MTIGLLLVIIAILLFGSSAILGAARLTLGAICALIVVIAFWSAGWTGVGVVTVVIIGYVANVFSKEQGKAQDRQRRVEKARKRNRDDALLQEKTAHVREAIELDRRLNAEYRAIVEARRKGEN